MANVHAVLMHVAENMVGWQKRLGEYPTLVTDPRRFSGNLPERKRTSTYTSTSLCFRFVLLPLHASKRVMHRHRPVDLVVPPPLNALCSLIYGTATANLATLKRPSI